MLTPEDFLLPVVYTLITVSGAVSAVCIGGHMFGYW